ncbi:MAG: antibiotic biosynthesis monooxygenase [Hymenobacteraceae bacterium]|nr:antibiotic biosynthesis monooxygenase [Hymenobacteraceae bacterium]
MFIALSTFEIANGMAAEVKEAFINRPRFVDNAPGFVKLDVLCPQEKPEEIWLMTFWADEESYQIWYRNHMKESHNNIPKGLKLVPHSAKVRFFDHIAG